MTPVRLILLTPLLALIILAGVYLLTPQAELELPVPRSRYLDAHAHIAGIGAGDSGCYIHPDLIDSFKFGFYLRGFGVSMNELRSRGDELVARRMNDRIAQSRYVRAAVILALDGVITDGELDREKTQVYVPNEFVSDMARKYLHLRYGASVNPERPDWRERLVRAKRDGALLIKWLPAIMHIDPADPRHISFYRTLAELKLPLLVHVGQERALSDVNDALGDPRRLELPLKEGVTVIAAHVGTTGEYEGQESHERLLEMFPEYPNLYADISSLTQINKLGYLVEILDAPGARERLLYGSDFPLQFFPVVSSFYHWPDIDLSDAKRIEKVSNKWDRDVLLKNALGVPREVFERSSQLLIR